MTCRSAGRGTRRSSSRILAFSVMLPALTFAGSASAETWRGLTVTPEHRCSPYERKRDYPYSQSVEQDIVRQLGAIYGPYTGTCFSSTTETDIEHIVATSEAHDSGLCAADRATRLGTLRRGSGHTKAVRPGPSQPHSRLPGGEPPAEERQRRR